MNWRNPKTGLLQPVCVSLRRLMAPFFSKRSPDRKNQKTIQKNMWKQDNLFRTIAENTDDPVQAIEKYRVLVRNWESHLNGLKDKHAQRTVSDETYHALLTEKIEGKTRAAWLAHSRFLLHEAKKAAAEFHSKEKKTPTPFNLP